MLKQEKAPFKNFLGDWQYSRQKLEFLVNHSSSEGIREAREKKMPLFSFYDTSRSKTKGGDLSINRFI